MRRASSIAQTDLSPASRRVLATFLSGRLPAGQLCHELARAESAPTPAVRLVLPDDTASIPVPRAA